MEKYLTLCHKVVCDFCDQPDFIIVEDDGLSGLYESAIYFRQMGWRERRGANGFIGAACPECTDVGEEV